ncbi:alkaline phosphatase [Streptomyces qinzhouensis]|uniref:Alkaline phosphatase n=1 Tax=Streptomyces qinzhouensis TaxID=2599401 RepID=A0A5B8IQ90_9ACTN|nr:alkaline phosphatase [Streptomyces qinzhouensis]
MRPAWHRAVPPTTGGSPLSRPSSPAHPAELRAAARHLLRRHPAGPETPGTGDRPGVGRRTLLTSAGAAAVLAFATGLPGSAHAAALDPARIKRDPFTLGVASGDPLPGSVLLWTRLAPRPYETGSGLPRGSFAVDWEVAEDDRFARIARRGSATAHPEFDHSLHVEVTGLEPARVYFYRFRTGKWISPVGRTRTAPDPGARVRELRVALASCQAYHDGYFTAHAHLAEEDLDAVLHLGDYLYEYPVGAGGGARAYRDRKLPGRFDRETRTLAEYRLRYGLYKSDPDLRAAHAAHPFVLTWDDHETENNYAGRKPENDVRPEDFLLRRAAAYRAYWENQPLRLPQRPKGPDMRLYRRLHFGRLAQFDVLDTRQYRSDQAYGDGWQRPGPKSEAIRRTMLGAGQERWLIDGWHSSTARWNLLPQQVTFARRRDVPGPGHKLSMDSWDGYPAARARVLAGAEAAGIRNLVVLTGDVHVAYGFDLKQDWDDPAARTVGAEIATTSISSGRNGTAQPANWSRLFEANPHLRFYDGRRGYTVLTLREHTARADFRAVPAVTVPGASVLTAGSLLMIAGSPGLRPV